MRHDTGPSGKRTNNKAYESIVLGSLGRMPIKNNELGLFR